MARKHFTLFNICLAGLVATACGQAETKPRADPAAPASAADTSAPAAGAAVALYEEAPCPTGPAGRPRAGQVFDYRMITDEGGVDPSALRRQTIRSVSGDAVEYDETLAMTGQGEFPPEARGVRLEILPTRILGESIRYEDAGQALAGLEPGGSASIPASYSRGGEAREAAAEVTFTGCGVATPAVAGAAGEAVRVYRLVMPYSTTLSPDELSETLDLQFVVSHARGWPVAERAASGTLVLATPAE